MVVPAPLTVRQEEREETGDKQSQHLEPYRERHESEDRAGYELLVIPLGGILVFQSADQEINGPHTEADGGGFPQDLAGDLGEDGVPGDVEARDQGGHFPEDPARQKVRRYERQKPADEVDCQNGALNGQKAHGELMYQGGKKREEIEGISVGKGALHAELLDLLYPGDVEYAVVDDNVLPHEEKIDSDEKPEPQSYEEPVLSQKSQEFDAFTFAHLSRIGLKPLFDLAHDDPLVLFL